MPAKSRRSRRVPQSRKTAASQSVPVSSGLASTGTAATRSSPAYAAKPKEDAAIAVVGQNVVREMAMIGLVTVVVMVLLVISYFVFR